jgi:outer membrane immunogenic protein
MRRLQCTVLAAVLGSVAALGLTSIAIAGGAAAPHSWTGWYGGVNAGYAWSAGGGADTSSCADPAASGFCAYAAAGGFPPIALDQKGLIGGGQVGYNWLTANFVWGVEADIQGAGVTGSATQTVTPPLSVPGTSTQEHKLNWFGTLRGRLGVPVNNWLLYGTGGLMFGGVSSSLTLAAPAIAFAATGSSSSTRVGWTVGAGAEVALAGRWTVKLEYLYYDLGSDEVTATSSSVGFVGDALTISQKTAGHIFRTGLNYRF